MCILSVWELPVGVGRSFVVEHSSPDEHAFGAFLGSELLLSPRDDKAGIWHG